MSLELGWSIKMRCGQRAKIINIVNENDIDVEFEDGGIIKHITYHKLLMRGFKSPIEKQNNLKLITYDKVKKFFENKGYILLTEEYINAHSPLLYICKKHPDIIQTIKWNKIQQGQGCKKCGYETVSKKLLSLEKNSYQEMIEIFEKENLTLLTSKEEYYNFPNPLIKFICPCAPDKIQEKKLSKFLQSPYCNNCHKNKMSKARKEKQYAEFVDICLKRGYIPVSKLENYKTVVTPMKYICKKHGEQITNLSHLREGKGCPICKESKGEFKIRTWLEEHNIRYEAQKRFPNLYNKSINAKLSYDFYLPDYNLLIEYQGEYHDGKVHEISPKRQKIENVINQKHNDELKKEYAKKNNYKLFEIWYWDFNNIEKILKKELKL